MDSNDTPPISVHLCTRDRLTEVLLLLQSFRTQTYKGQVDFVIVDGSQPQSVFAHQTAQSMLNRLKLENSHKIVVYQIAIPGVCHARQMALEKDPWPENPLILRIDDDAILTPTYIADLMEGINAGYDLVSGLTPHCASPEILRETKFVKPIMSKIDVNDAGEIQKFGDDQAFLYDTEEIVPTHHFRSSALYKRKIHENGNDYKLGLSAVGFREEAWISLRAIKAGFFLGVSLKSRYFHFQTPSGGCRFADYNQLVQLDEHHFREWFKRNKYRDVLKAYDQRLKEKGFIKE